MLRRSLFAVSTSMAFTLGAAAQENPLSVETVVVTAVSPVVGTAIDASDVPAALNGIGANDIARENSQNITDVLQKRIPGVTISSETGNDYEPDVQFRGYTATPLSGVPEGLAVYQNGVRINEAFGDEVHWDFIPTVAIQSMDVLSNNPVFGLNALGGAIDTQMKSGFTYQGFETDVQGGSFGRVQDSTQFGQQNGHTSIYAALEFASDVDGGSFRPRQSGASMAILATGTGVQKFISTSQRPMISSALPRQHPSSSSSRITPLCLRRRRAIITRW